MLAVAAAATSEREMYPFADDETELTDPSLADWIAPPDALWQREGLYLFRKAFSLEQVPRQLVVHLSADPRYKLFVNSHLVTLGPAAGDPLAWHYETVDIGPYLISGENVLAVEVWDAGPHAPARQVSLATAMILQSPDVEGASLRSDRSWRVTRSAGWSALPMDGATVGGGYIAGATESLVFAEHPWGWTKPGFDDEAWHPAEVRGKGGNGKLDTWKGTAWPLVARPIPLLALQERSAGRIRRVTINDAVTPAEEWPLTIPPHSQARVLIDRGTIDLGFPQLHLDGGAGARVRLRYQEALFQPEGGKGDRDVIEGKVMKGYYDELQLDGASRTYEPAWLRTYRYLEITAETGEQPLLLRDLTLRQARYPFERRGSFASSDASLGPVLEACWRTAEVCALETYMDCPYYEQVQYVGDTRIQALISLYLTGDDRLMRNAILQFHRSRQPNGLTRSSYPTGSRTPQLIPPFALLYVSMVHDYFMHREDPNLLQELLPGIRFTLEWFLARLDDRGLVGPLPYWNHTDGGAAGFRNGSPPGASTGGSIQLTLLLAATLDEAADLCLSAGREEEAEGYRAQALALKRASHQHGYNDARGLYAETPDQQVFSQHTNAYAILTGTVPPEREAALAERLVQDPSLVQATLYFQFYVFAALREAGRADLIQPELARWKEMLDVGLTTFPEHGPESRSDAHAWAAHPLYHLLASTAGVMPAAPGFRSVRVRPAPGDMTWLQATVCHPQGAIEVAFERQSDGGWRGTVELPASVDGTLEWNGRPRALRAGRNDFTLEALRGVDQRARGQAARAD